MSLFASRARCLVSHAVYITTAWPGPLQTLQAIIEFVTRAQIKAAASVSLHWLTACDKTTASCCLSWTANSNRAADMQL